MRFQQKVFYNSLEKLSNILVFRVHPVLIDRDHGNARRVRGSGLRSTSSSYTPEADTTIIDSLRVHPYIAITIMSANILIIELILKNLLICIYVQVYDLFHYYILFSNCHKARLGFKWIACSLWCRRFLINDLRYNSNSNRTDAKEKQYFMLQSNPFSRQINIL